MSTIEQTLVLTEVLSQMQQLLDDTAHDNIVFGAKNMAASTFLDDANPALRQRLVAMAGVMIGAILIIDQRGDEPVQDEDVATNG